jgi:hypothetical protein
VPIDYGDVTKVGSEQTWVRSSAAVAVDLETEMWVVVIDSAFAAVVDTHRERGVDWVGSSPYSRIADA